MMYKKNSVPVTLILPIYYGDSCFHLSQALNSIINLETFPMQCIIGFDGRVSEEARSLVDSFTTSYPFQTLLFESDENIGLGFMINEMVSRSQFEIIARMDADDLCRSDRFTIQYSLMVEKQLDICGGQIQEFRVTPGDLFWKKRVPCKHDEILRMLKFKSPFTHPSILFRKTLFEKVGGFIRLPPIEDYDFFVRCALAGGRFGNCEEIILDFRVGESFEMIKRRRGFKYLRKEIYLYYNLFYIKYKYFNLIELILVLPKTLLRLMPEKLLYLMYVNSRRNV